MSGHGMGQAAPQARSHPAFHGGRHGSAASPATRRRVEQSLGSGGRAALRLRNRRGVCRSRRASVRRGPLRPRCDHPPVGFGSWSATAGALRKRHGLFPAEWPGSITRRSGNLAGPGHSRNERPWTRLLRDIDHAPGRRPYSPAPASAASRGASTAEAAATPAKAARPGPAHVPQKFGASSPPPGPCAAGRAGSCAIMQSVVSTSAAMEAAFCSASRVTLAGSITPI